MPMPSTALKTEMAGVIMPSPYSRQAAKSPRAMTPSPRRLPEGAPCPRIRAVRAITPPSPWLSARKTNTMYFRPTIMTSAQNIKERMPITLIWLTAIPYSPWKHSRMAYIGLVPISPKTTPRAASDSCASVCWSWL